MKNTAYSFSYPQNTKTADLSSSEAGIDALSDIQHKLYLAGDEQKRMGDEGGISLSSEQNANVNRYFRASHRIKKLLSVLGYRAKK